MDDSPSRKKKKKGDKIHLHAYISPALFDEISRYRNPDDEDRWQSALLRRIIKEWLAFKKGGSSEGAEGARGPLPEIPPKREGELKHAPYRQR